jgi:hypothetical protein
MEGEPFALGLVKGSTVPRALDPSGTSDRRFRARLQSRGKVRGRGAAARTPRS